MASLGPPDNSHGLLLALWSMVSWGILGWYLESVEKGCADRPPLCLRMPNVCWPWSVESRAGPFCQLFPAHIDLLYNSWRKPLCGDWCYQMLDLKISSMTLGIFFKSQIRTTLCKEAKSIMVLSASLNEFTLWECAFHESVGKSEQTWHTLAGVSHSQTELHHTPSPNP